MTYDLQYDWVRFWCPRDRQFLLSDDGYLYDPSGQWSTPGNPNLVTLDQISNVKCVVLLGEPGIGKSTAIREYGQNVKLRIDSNSIFIDVDLRTGDTEQRILDMIFGSDEFETWKSDQTKNLHLHIDSLDECMLRVETVAMLLADYLNKLSKDSLFLRIACRTADWPDLLEISLIEQWGKESVSVVELAPLRKVDVASAAASCGIDPKAFLNEVHRVDVVPFAIKPVTLKFLLNIFRECKSLSRSQTELYTNGCRILSEERSMNRRTAKKIGLLSPDQRMAVASRIAAVTMFGNRYAVFTGLDTGNVPPGTVNIDELIGGVESASGVEFSVTPDAVRETLGCGLFNSRGASLLGFAHQTYAEHLAAWYLKERKLTAPQMLSLIQHPGDPDCRIIPQLHETAARMASANDEIFDAVLQTNPDVLLGSDVITITPESRSRLTQALLDFADHIHAIGFGARTRRYAQLVFPTLDELLRPAIIDKSQPDGKRLLAIEIATACKCKAVQPYLVAVILDKADTLHIRSEAARALAKFGELEFRTLLKPLAANFSDEDPDDELKGYVLRNLWPSVLTVEELFSLLTPETNPNLSGAYAEFLYDCVLPNLEIGDLPSALEWASSQQVDITHTSNLEHLINGILIRGWNNLDQPNLIPAFARAAMSRLKRDPQLFSDHQYSDSAPDIHSAIDKRRELVREIVKAVDDPDGDTSLIAYCCPPLVLCTDMAWLLQEYQSSEGKARLAFLKLIGRTFNYDCAYMDELLTAAANDCDLNLELQPYLSPVRLFSEDAQALKRQYQMIKKPEKIKQENHAGDFDRASTIDTLLNRFEAGNITDWYKLTFALSAKEGSGEYRLDFYLDIKQQPGWQIADAGTRSRLKSAATTYLKNYDPSPDRWLSATSPTWLEIAGSRALAFVANGDADGVTDLPASVWLKWIPHLVAFPMPNGSDYDLLVATLKLAYTKLPEDTIKSILLLARERGNQVNTTNPIDLAEFIWDRRFAESVLLELDDPQLTANVKGVFLSALLRYTPIGLSDIRGSIQEIAEKIVRQGAFEGDSSLALTAAHSLVFNAENCGWATVWNAIVDEPQFGRSLIERIARVDRRPNQMLVRLSERQISDLFLWMSSEYPHTEDERVAGSHFVSIREKVADLRDSLLKYLENLGTTASLTELHRIASIRHDLHWLKPCLYRAREATRRKTWIPPTPTEILSLVSSSSKRLISSGKELQELVMESLGRYQEELHGEIPSAQSLWNKVSDGWEPGDEKSVSDAIVIFLKRDIGRGLIITREAQIRRGAGSTQGQNTDIHVDAVVIGADRTPIDTVSVIIEVKGNWNQGLLKDMKRQLVDRYLKDNACKHGIYLTAWFECENLAPSSSSRKTKRLSKSEITKRLDSEAASLSKDGLIIKNFVLDVSI